MEPFWSVKSQNNIWGRAECLGEGASANQGALGNPVTDLPHDQCWDHILETEGLNQQMIAYLISCVLCLSFTPQ